MKEMMIKAVVSPNIEVALTPEALLTPPELREAAEIWRQDIIGVPLEPGIIPGKFQVMNEHGFFRMGAHKRVVGLWAWLYGDSTARELLSGLDVRLTLQGCRPFSNYPVPTIVQLYHF